MANIIRSAKANRTIPTKSMDYVVKRLNVALAGETRIRLKYGNQKADKAKLKAVLGGISAGF